jgi:hypothetical protein
MEISGTIIKLLPLQTGQSKNGGWKKQDFILETEDQYPKKVCISAWGDKIDQFQLAEGKKIKAAINIESREYNEKWYTDVKVWRVDPLSDMPDNNTSEKMPPAHFETIPLPTDDFGSQGEDDLPF